MSEAASRKSLLTRALLVLLAVVVLVVVLAWLLTPWWLARWIPQQLEQQFGWQVEVGDIRIQPFSAPLSATVTIADLTARDPSGEPVLSWAVLSTRLSLSALIRGQLDLAAITVTAPYLHLAPGLGQVSGGLDPLSAWPDRRQWLRWLDRDLRLNDGELKLTLPGGEGRPHRNKRLGIHSLLVEGAVDNRNDRVFTLQASGGRQTLELNGRLNTGTEQLTGTVDARNLSRESLALLGQLGPDLEWLAGEGDLVTEFEWHPRQGLVTRNGQVVLRDIMVALPGEQEPWLSLKELTVAGLAVMVADRELVVSALALNQPHLTLERHQDASLHWPALPVDRPWSGARWHWSLGETTVADGRLTWVDARFDAPVDVRVNGLELAIGAMTERLEEPVIWQLRGALDDGGSLSARGQYTLRPRTLSASFDADQWLLTGLAPYLELPEGFELHGGLLSLEGQIDLDGQQAPVTGTFEGQGTLSHLDIRGAGGDDTLLGWRELRLESIEYNLTPARLELGRATLSEPTLQVTLTSDGQVNLAPLLSGAWLTGRGPGAQEGEPVAVPGIIFRMQELGLAGGELRYRDEGMSPPFRSRLHQLEGRLVRLSNVAPLRGRLDLNGQLNEASFFELAGAIGTMKEGDQEVVSEEPVELDMVLALEYRLSGLPAQNRFRSGVDRLLSQLPGEAGAGLEGAPAYLSDNPAGGGRPVQGRFRLDLH